MTSDHQVNFNTLYHNLHDGDIDHTDETWTGLFKSLADRIILDLGPASVLDAGCGRGYLLRALRQCGVEAWGIDISENAIRNALPEIQPYCQVGSILEPFPHPHYDLIVCLEVVEHLLPDEAERVVENLCQHSDDILLSSSPFDFHEPGHVNFQPPEYWAVLFNRFGFIHDIDFDASFIAPWAMRFLKAKPLIEDRLINYESKIWHLSQEITLRRNLGVEYKKELAKKEMDLQYWRLAPKRLQAELDAIRNSTSWQMITRLQNFRERIIPLGSRREVAMRTTFRGINILRREGLISFFNRIRQKASWQAKVFTQGIRFKLTTLGESKVIEVDDIHVNPQPQPHQAMVDIVICVHNALADVQQCLESVLKHTNPPFALTLVDDGSDDDSRRYLEDFTKEHQCTLLRNHQALGYTLAANQGLRQSTAEFVILLNSDTIVTPGWVDRMIACAQSNPKIGLVGPLSNGATYQSIPEIITNGEWANNILPSNISAAQMGEWVANKSWRLYPEMKFLNGFCLLIRRQMMDQIGYFDEENFGVGYGEENDYCLRAHQAGWQLALADDTYIFHAQSRSYNQERRQRLSERANTMLAQKYGQQIIDEGTTDNRENRILEGIRSHSRYIIEREELIQQGRERFANRRVLFVLPIWVSGGGANVIVLATQAMRRMGVDAQIMNLYVHRPSFESSYPDLNVPVIYGDIEDIPNHAVYYDAVVATFNPTVSWIAPALRQRSDLKIGYYIQDYEPYFYPPNTDGFHKAADSYTLIPNLVRCVTTQWIYDQIQHYHGVSCYIIGASFDTDLFWPRPHQDPTWPDRPLRIAAMIRPHSERRSPRMTMEILKQASKMYGSMLEFKLFGCKPSDPGFGPLPQDFPWHLAGELRPMQIANLLNETDIFVDYSVFQALGLTAMESMSCGVATIVPDYGGTNTFARNEENCLVVDTHDPTACFNALQRLIEDHTLRQKIQKNAISAAIQFHPELPTYNLLSALFPVDK
jgi:GT2 family glycosyltransferase/SAM-dependent methyltransferase/glycosyltransferase involved in cell wall biosynthesis